MPSYLQNKQSSKETNAKPSIGAQRPSSKVNGNRIPPSHGPMSNGSKSTQPNSNKWDYMNQNQISSEGGEYEKIPNEGGQDNIELMMEIERLNQ